MKCSSPGEKWGGPQRDPRELGMARRVCAWISCGGRSEHNREEITQIQSHANCVILGPKVQNRAKPACVLQASGNSWGAGKGIAGRKHAPWTL